MNLAHESFGQPGQYYAVHQQEAMRASREPPSPVERKIADLLRQHDPNLKDRVIRSYKRWNPAVRDHLRTEMALRLTVGERAQAIPVRIKDGFPKPFADIVGLFPPQGLRGLLNYCRHHTI